MMNGNSGIASFSTFIYVDASQVLPFVVDLSFQLQTAHHGMPSFKSIASALATIFGVGVDVSGLFGGEANTPSNVTRIHVGQQEGADGKVGNGPGGSPGGHAPGITIWDGIGKLIGTIEGKGNIGGASLKDYSFDTGADNRAAEYVSVSAAGTDGICIQAVTLNAANGNDYAWFGDVGQVCGVP